MTLASSLSDRLTDIRARIERATARAGRAPGDVTLVAVSKTYPVEHVREAAAAGQVDFGENRVQEALPKIEAASNLGLSWHLIGHLQSNKARKAAAAFPWIHSVDRLELLQALEKAALDAGTTPRILIQVDLAGEATKHGTPENALNELVDAALGCRALSLSGLMILPPFLDNPEEVRPYFRRLRELRDALVARGVPPDRLHHLSMGMSHDFEVAIEEGATFVRVGTAIFGARG